nr:hypothetical protein [Tanacetum cinerariifolium]
MPRKDMNAILDTLQATLKEVVPLMVDEATNDNIKKNLPMVVKEAIKLERKNTKDDIDAMVVEAIRKEQDHHHDDDGHLERESNAKRKKMSECGTYTRGNEILTTDEQKQIQEALNDMMRNQYSMGKQEKDLSLQIPREPTLVLHSCKRDPNAPSMVLINKQLFYLKNRNFEIRKYILSLHKYHAVPFPENGLLERKNTKDDIDAMVVEAIRKEQDRIRAELSLQVTNDVANNVPP